MNHSFSIGEKIKIARTIRNVSQRGLAHQIGLSYAAVCLIENDKIGADKHLDAIEAALGLKFDDPQIEAAFAILAGHDPAGQELPDAS